jgi:hypothetical protein
MTSAPATVNAEQIERQSAAEIERGQWPTWPFTRLTPDQVRQLARKRTEQRRAALDDAEPAPF